MKSLLGAIAAAVLILSAGVASAATRQIDFSFGPLDNVGTTAPFGLSLGDTVSGSFQFDDSGFTGAGNYLLSPIMTSLSFVTGTKTWSLGEIASTGFDNIKVNAANQITQWTFNLIGLDGKSIAASNNTLNLSGTVPSSFIFCNNCSSFSEVPVSPVPLPAGLGLAFAAFGSIALVGSRRRRRG